MKIKINKTKIIGLLTMLIALWLILYFIPELFVSLFNTLLGNLILMVSVILVYMNNRLYALLFGLVLIILYRFSHLSREKLTRENFTSDSQLDFLQIQNTINKQNIFDMDIIKSQATQSELDYFNENGMWPWSQEVIDLYEAAITKNPYIRTVPELATKYARTKYNQNAILMLLSYQTKEGQFLLNGVLIKDPSGNKMEELPSGFGNFPYKSGLLEDRRDDIIRCNMDDPVNPYLERIRYTGKGGIFGEQTYTVTPIDYNDLEEKIPGFSFYNKPCNPCKAIASRPDYSCPFRLNVKDRSPYTSGVWEYLWRINDKPLISE